MEFWTAEQYAARASLPLRTAQYRLRLWFKTGKVRVARETLPARGRGRPPRFRYLLDVASWRTHARIPDDHAADPQGQDHARPGRAA